MLRRPTPSMAVATAALFVSLGGVGYAASELPANSVGRAQIQNDAVNYQKIAPGSVGITRINSNSVQARVLGTCDPGGAEAAIAAIDAHGRPVYHATRPREFDTSTSSPVPIATGATAVADVALPKGPCYLILATPYVQVTGTAGTAQQVTVSCSIATSPLDTKATTRAATFDLSAGEETASEPMPLTLALSANSTTDTATLQCSQTTSGQGTSPTVAASATMNAIETSGKTTQPDTASTTGPSGAGS